MNDSVTDILSTRSPKTRSGHPAAALVVDDDPRIREFMRFSLAQQCAFVEVAHGTRSAEALRQRYRFDVIITDNRMPDGSGLEWVAQLRRSGITTPVIVMTAYVEDIDTELGTRLGNVQFLSKPFALDQMLAAVRFCLDESAKAPVGEKGVGPLPDAATTEAERGIEGVVGHSDAMRDLLTLIRRVASRNTTVLLEGESGTGKEVAARCLHHFSNRSGPFVAVNCGAFAGELLESELFGHVKGAFTGATHSREGLFVHASGGTLLLDEICEMPLALQAKLLRVLEQRAIRPVGAERETPVDVRVVTATNRVMAEQVEQGLFREDLYHRLNVLGLRLPPLRERPTDIPHLARLFARDLGEELALPPLEFSDRDLQRLQQHHWPGNVRELKNLIERAMLLNQPAADCLALERFEAPLSLGETGSDLGYPSDMPLEEVEKQHILKVVRATDGNKSEAARRLGVSRKTLERKFRQWQQEG